MSFFKKIGRLTGEQLRTLAQLCGGVAILLLFALAISGGGLGTTTALPPSTSQAAATPFGTANFGLPNQSGGYLHQLSCYRGAVGGASYNGSTGYPPCADSSWNAVGTPGYPVTTIEFSVRQTGAYPGRTGVSTFTSSYVSGNSVVVGPANKVCPVPVDQYGVCGPGWTYNCDGYTAPSGYGSISGDTTNCYAYQIMPDTTSVAYYGSTTPAFTSGSSITAEWSCQPQISYIYTYCTGSFGCNSVESSPQTKYYYQSGSNSGGLTAIGSTAGGTMGTRSLTASCSGTPPCTNTVTLSCTGSVGTAQVPITYSVTAPLYPPPTALINAGAGNGVTKTVAVGTPVPITTSYTLGAGDTAFTQTAVNGPLETNGQNCASGTTGVSGLDCSTNTNPKSFTFTPAAVGTYTFYPDMKTTYYTGWGNNSTGAQVQVVAAAACPNGSGVAGSCTACNSGYVLSGGNCVAQCSNGSGPSGACTSCNAGYDLTSSSVTNKIYPPSNQTSWTVPADWSSNYIIEAIGAGGGGKSGFYGGGGGGGAYAKITSGLSLTPGNSVTYQVGVGGTPGTSGSDTYFNRTAGSAGTCADTTSLCAKGGAGATGSTGASGGSAISSFGTTKNAGGAGGNGGIGSNTAGGGGGGAGGPLGAGGAGGKDDASNGSGAGGAGGGGNGGGTAGGSDPGGGAAAVGGNNAGGTGAGRTGGYRFGNGTNVQATNGGGGFGGTPFDAAAAHVATFISGGAGGAGTEWDASHGSGGGGGGGASDYSFAPATSQGNGGAGGLYGGGGGGGATAGSGAPGLIAVTYTVTSNTCVSNTCAGGQTNPPTCSICPAGTHDNGFGTCVSNVPSGLTLTVQSNKVRKGNPAVLSWSVSGLSSGVGTSCSVTSNPAGVFSQTMPANTTPTWSATNVSTGAINSTTVFTLACTGANPISKTVTVVPVVIEI